MDLKNYSLESLRALRNDVEVEIRHRVLMEHIPAQMNELSSKYLDAQGVKSGDEWKSMTPYPKGWEVVHEGERWLSLIPGNVWEPGVAGWRAIAVPGEPPRPWKQPSGSADPYQIQERVTHNGQIWTCIVENNVWEPGVYGWQPDPVEPEEEPEPPEEPEDPEEPDPEDPEDPEEPEDPPEEPEDPEDPPEEPEEPEDPEDDVPEWSPDSHVYEAGDQVMFQGALYTCIQGHTSQAGWTPLAVTSLWSPA